MIKFYMEYDLGSCKGFVEVPKDFFKGVVECLQSVSDVVGYDVVVTSKWIKLPEGKGRRYYALDFKGEYHVFGYCISP